MYDHYKYTRCYRLKEKCMSFHEFSSLWFGITSGVYGSQEDT